MVLNGFDSVKAISMANSGRRRKLKWLFEFIMFLFLVFHRSSLFSLAGPFFRHFFRRILVVLNSHTFVFIVFHAMLFVVYSLSHLTDNNSGSNRTDAESTLDARSSHVTADDSPESLIASKDDSVDDKLVVDEKNTATALENSAAPVDDSVAEKNTEKSPVSKDSIDPTTTTTAPTPGSPVLHLIIPETRQYRRTESERFEENRQRAKLRRSKTEIRREESRESTKLRDSVEEMDIDDFNRKVERFIAEQKLHIGGRISDSDK
ncbi:hypothetical protein SDJN03_18313, partial [Cucurbita argyrosperma subsp. sororia]